MNFYLFYTYAALCGLVSIEAPATAMHKVTSFTGLGYSEGSGFLAYLRSSGLLVFAGEGHAKYRSGEQYYIRRAGEHEYLSSGVPMMAALRVYGESDGDSGKRFHLRNAIESYSYSDGDKSLVFRLKERNKEVRIIFSENAGCTTFAGIFNDAGITLRN